MKKTLSTLAAGLLALLAYAQDDCTTVWPYIYSDFQQASLHMVGKPPVNEMVNIHTLQSKLHYIDSEGIIREMSLSKLLVAELACGHKYAVVNGGMMQMMENRENGFIGLQKTADLAALNETGGAYGTSSTTSSTMKLSSIEVAGANTGHMELLERKHDGEALSLKETYYIIAGDKCCKATKKDLTELAGEARGDELKALLKSRKIKWKDPASLAELIDFVAKL